MLQISTRLLLTVILAFATNPLHAKSPWAGHHNFEELRTSINNSFPVIGHVLQIHKNLVSHEGHRGEITHESKIGDEFFCDFQLRTNHETRVEIVLTHGSTITEIEPYLGADQEISRVGVIFKLSSTLTSGENNPLELVACIRNQQRDQFEGGWTLDQETNFDLNDLKRLSKDKITFTKI